MASFEKAESHSSMRAACLLGVLILARILVLAGRDIPVSVWTPIAYVWQDLLVVLIFACVDNLVRSARAGWILYALLVIYIAANVPVALVLSSPMTLTMMRATGGPLSDSIAHHLTLTNVGALVSAIAAGIALPFLLKRVNLRAPKTLVVVSIAIVLVGPFSTSRLDTLGMHRNAFGALWPVRLPDMPRTSETSDWRKSPKPPNAGESVLKYRGAAAGRNVVLVILESTGAGYLHSYGAVEDPTPHLTQLAAQSIFFENAYAVYPESIKGLLSTLCSRYPQFDTPAEVVAASPCISMAQRFVDRGYRAALFHSGRFMYLGMQPVVEKRGFETLADAATIGGNTQSSFGVDEPSTVKRMLSWVDEGPAGKPFFLAYLPVAGHHPYATPDGGPFGQDTELSNYRNALHYGDAALGDLLKGLHDRHVDDRTLFIVFGDHGEAFGQHAGNFGHTLFIYEENIRVPLLISAPGLIRDQIRVDRAASLIDVLPTVLDLTGLPIPDSAQGHSLLDPVQRTALFFTDYSLGLLGLRDSCWKFIHETDSGRSKLYDVCKDPGEREDVSGAEPARVMAYRTNLEGWISTVTDRRYSYASFVAAVYDRRNGH